MTKFLLAKHSWCLDSSSTRLFWLWITVLDVCVLIRVHLVSRCPNRWVWLFDGKYFNTCQGSIISACALVSEFIYTFSVLINSPRDLLSYLELEAELLFFYLISINLIFDPRRMDLLVWLLQPYFSLPFPTCEYLVNHFRTYFTTDNPDLCVRSVWYGFQNF